jgi:hypothetical protein
LHVGVETKTLGEGVGFWYGGEEDLERGEKVLSVVVDEHISGRFIGIECTGGGSIHGEEKRWDRGEASSRG